MYKAHFTHREWEEWKRLKRMNPDHTARLRGEPRAFNPEGAGSSPDAPSNVRDIAKKFSGNY